MSTHNIGFYEDLTKIIFELSSNTHLISSAATHNTNQAVQPQKVARVYILVLETRDYQGSEIQRHGSA